MWRFGLVVLAVGCAAPPPAEPRASGWLADSKPALLDIELQNHLSWPYRLRALLVVLDGAVLYSEIEREPTTEIAHLSGVARGDHVLQVLAKISYSSGSLDDVCLLSLRTSKAFTLSSRALRIQLDARSGAVTHPFSERVAVDVRLPDSPPSELGPRAPGEPSACD